ncbi:alpha-L-fucosidase [Aeoliella mucimassa]|uniref:alpha-L-fucosidase n=1 Tax=Aeoliella mucimassa TaxID=2527972 RepID=A0A518ALK5_9BACT|nr:alpha-L-fucosidase [Aeoliella mucimassa]QDU55599.1 Alpha-L-fucosidase [Aeoliella mucimassa]
MPSVSRRRFLQSATALGVTQGLLQSPASLLAQPPVTANSNTGGTIELARPTAAQQRWQDCELGLIYHFDMPVAAGDTAPNNTTRKRFDPALYNPTKLDTDQWIEAAKALGAKYAVFTATHFNGFMQWQSDLYPYGVKQAKWRDGKGDVVADFVESCRKADILPGIYFSTHRNVYWEVWGHYVDWGRGRGTEKQQQFNRVAEKMTEELCSRYGPLVQIWFDAGVMTPQQGGPDVLPIFEQHQPDSVFYHSGQRSDHRWIGNEAGHAGSPCWATMPAASDGEFVSHNSSLWKPHLHSGVAGAARWSPGMVDVPLRGANGTHNWFWSPNQDDDALSLSTLETMYDQSVGRNCNFILGEVVNSEGLVPESDIERLQAFGDRLRERFATPVGETSGFGELVELTFAAPQRVDQVVLMEDIEQGERVRSYVVEGRTEDGAWHPLAKGQSIGALLNN